MNIMKHMKHAEGVAGMREKNKAETLFYSFSTVWKAVLCSFSFITFINLVMRHGLTRFDGNFMNFMKIYEGGVFMAIFGNAVLYGSATPLLWADFMNLENGRTSLNFINREV